MFVFGFLKAKTLQDHNHETHNQRQRPLSPQCLESWCHWMRDGHWNEIFWQAVSQFGRAQLKVNSAFRKKVASHLVIMNSLILDSALSLNRSSSGAMSA